MHELALCRAIAGIAERHAEGRPVARVHVQVGQLKAIEPEALALSWPTVAVEPPLVGSLLDVESVPVGVVCRSCLQDSTLAAGEIRCPVCGAAEVRMIHGEELVVTTVEIMEVLP